ncbi:MULTISPECIES: RDD family protein [unclassified Streptomyces]|uniref:RDD family protein n=1 Tax=unclassified Streptomyces TaxID=2593676 RepID=UPI001E4E85F8|nr:RDD family protein [Streptomyces sp. CB02980]MCB8906483.1 RDD family protein [Streptomyces sp. CB02980]
MATPPGGGGEVPQAGYYPDPSIPGYIRFWNGGAWVPGTSRPAPTDGEVPPGPPASAIPAGPILASGPAPAPAAAQPARPEPEPVQPHQPAQHQLQEQQHQLHEQQHQLPEQQHQLHEQPYEPQQLPEQQHRSQPQQLQEQQQYQPQPYQPQHQLPEQSYQPQSAPQLEPVRPAASVPAQDRAPAQLPAQDRAPALAPVPTVEETGPVFFDEEQAPAEPASAWQADTSRQTGFGGDLDQKVSWGAPRTPDPRTPADWPVAGAGEPEPENAARSAAPATDPRATGGAARLGGMPVTPIPTPTPTPATAPQQPQPAPQAPRPQPAAAAAPAPAPAPVHQAPAPAPAPATPSWAQQAQPQPQAQQPQPQSQDPQQPVVPWKPPVDDLFVQAARAQASARPAGLGRRLIARLIDTLVLGALVGAAAFPSVTAALDHINGKIEAAKQSGVTVQVWLVDGTTSVQFGIALAAFFVIGVLYEALPTAKWGRTLGKKLCGIEVRDIESHQPPRFGAALRRWLVYSVLGLLAVGVLNVLWCLFDRPWRQCWHDKAARTFVAR